MAQDLLSVYGKTYWSSKWGVAIINRVMQTKIWALNKEWSSY
jgi:hypothetical protein